MRRPYTSRAPSSSSSSSATGDRDDSASDENGECELPLAACVTGYTCQPAISSPAVKHTRCSDATLLRKGRR